MEVSTISSKRFLLKMSSTGRRTFAEEDIARDVPSVVGSVTASRGLEVAVANLQEYCNGMLTILFSAMLHYVATRPMFIDVEVMNSDTRLVLGEQGSQASPSNVARGLSSLYKEITDTVRKEAATIMDVFLSPNDVMSILVQRVLEQRITILLDKLLVKPSLVNPPPMKEGGLLLYLRMLAVAYEKTQELVRELRAVGCGDLDVEDKNFKFSKQQRKNHLWCEHCKKPGHMIDQCWKLHGKPTDWQPTWSRFQKEPHIASQDDSSSSFSKKQIEELQQILSSMTAKPTNVTYTTTDGNNPYASLAQGSKRVIGSAKLGKGLYTLGGLMESLFSSHKDEYPEHEQASLGQLYQAKLEELRAENQNVSNSTGTVRRSKGASVSSSHQQISVAVVTEFLCSLAYLTNQYITDGLERARGSLIEAAAMRERFVLGTNLSRRVAAAAASVAEAAAAAGESSFRSFMISVQRCGSSVAIVQQYFANSISRLLLPVDGSHAASCEEMATAMSSAEGAAHKGLQQCIETVMAEGNRLYKGLLNHWQKFTFNPSGLRLKRDIMEYGEFVRSFNAPSVDEKFELLGILANVFIVAPESLSSLFEGTPSIRKDAQRFIQLRDDYKGAKLASGLSSLWSRSS
ncbi:Exocyst complex component SEC10 [Hibiscus syriacus]|uniref:Exocyst complex component SEC10 n=2 Tax=Hibiscus syriacus TaxID=106335 RepID=A0A6A3CBT2_HIBSY|nr:Exocyst complex component SEC10 [Hibiscus syriacus]